eukprot:283703-Pleurochrysis_carterae.AAC.1
MNLCQILLEVDNFGAKAVADLLVTLDVQFYHTLYQVFASSCHCRSKKPSSSIVSTRSDANMHRVLHGRKLSLFRNLPSVISRRDLDSLRKR